MPIRLDLLNSNKAFILFLWLVFGATTLGFSQDNKSGHHFCKKKPRIRVLPLAYYTPETRLALGGLFYYVFCVKKEDTVSRRSNIQQYATFTINRQFIFENSWQVYSPAEKYIFNGEMDYARFPELFFGIGNSTKWESMEYYSFDRFKINSTNLKNLGNRWFLGIQYNLQYLFNLKTDQTKMMQFEDIPGSKGFFVHGIGPIIIHDTRDNVLNTFSGNYLELSYSNYSKYLGSHFNYQNFTLDVRKFIPVKKRFTWAINYYSNLNFGELPYRSMPAIGGGRFLRGYYAGRFRDNHLMVLQTEFRGDLFWRFGFAVFTGLGRVAHTIGEFGQGDWKYTVGAGIRFKINRAENVNVRLDYGYTGESHGLYILFAEAF